MSVWAASRSGWIVGAPRVLTRSAHSLTVGARKSPSVRQSVSQSVHLFTRSLPGTDGQSRDGVWRCGEGREGGRVTVENFVNFVRSFVCWFVRSFGRSFIRSFVWSLVRSLRRSFGRWFVGSFVSSLVHFAVRSLLCFVAFVRSFVRLPAGGSEQAVVSVVWDVCLLVLLRCEVVLRRVRFVAGFDWLSHQCAYFALFSVF